MGAAILWNSFVLKSTTIALFNITSSISASLHLYQITLANNTDSKIAKDEQNSQTAKFVTHFWRKTKTIY
jgi:hypothetical protein